MVLLRIPVPGLPGVFGVLDVGRLRQVEQPAALGGPQRPAYLHLHKDKSRKSRDTVPLRPEFLEKMYLKFNLMCPFDVPTDCPHQKVPGS